MKATGKCPKCKSARIGHLDMQLDMVGQYGGTPAIAAVGLTQDDKKAGMFEARVCVECGFYETYVKGPAQVPFEQMKGFRWASTVPRG
jgi:predicted Zn-ribbon and HTH transcriptional regulator